MAKGECTKAGNNPALWHTTNEIADPRAVALCNSCEVRETCLLWAIEEDERFDVWGGLTRTERVRFATKLKREQWAKEQQDLLQWDAV